MVILKNKLQRFSCDDFINSCIKNEETNCILYSQDGMKFSVHKEIFCHTKFMRSILKSANNACCAEIRILCPCSGEELKSIVNFLYSGMICYCKESDLNQAQDNLTNIFGFPEDLFAMENQSTSTEESEIINQKIGKISDETSEM